MRRVCQRHHSDGARRLEGGAYADAEVRFKRQLWMLFDEVAGGDNKTAIGAEEEPGNSTQHLIWEGEGAQLFRSNIVSRVVRLEIDRVGGAPSDNQCSVQNNSPVSSVTYISWLRVPATGDDGRDDEARAESSEDWATGRHAYNKIHGRRESKIDDFKKIMNV